MRRKLLRFFILSIFVLGASVGAVSAQGEAGDLLARINNLRASVGRPGYTLNGALSAAAQSQAQWMADTGEIVHTRPDGSSPRSRAMNAGYPSAMVSENIYRGSNAGVDAAWNFWINSPIHYNGLVSPNYAEVGIGAASGSTGRAYVLVFGNPGGWAGAPAAAASGGNAAAVRAEPQRIYAIGVDDRGYIMHLIATGDTLGDIALIYGYTWDDLPSMMALNELADPRELLPGEIFFVPPKAGTFTPSPGGPTDTPVDTPTLLPATITPFVAATATPDELATMMFSEIASEPTLQALGVINEQGTPIVPTPATMVQEQLPAETGIAVVDASAAQGQDAVVGAGVVSNPGSPRSNTSTLIIVAVAIQAGIILMAAIEFVRRARRKPK
jgi:hypothetical protein